jgi:hypothetical protein
LRSAAIRECGCRRAKTPEGVRFAAAVFVVDTIGIPV